MALSQNEIDSFHSFLAAGQPQAAPKKKGNLLTKMLPSVAGTAGGVGGAAIGTALLPGIGTLAGALIGGALGGGAGKIGENKIEGNKNAWDGVGKEAAINGVMSAGPLRLLKGATTGVKSLRAGTGLAEALNATGQAAKDFSVLGRAGQAVSNTADNMVTKNFRLTPTQLTNYKTKFGEDAAATIKTHGLVGQAPEVMRDKVIKPLQNEFNTVASNIPAVTRQSLEASFKKIYEPLIKSPVQDSQAFGQALKEQADTVLNKVAKTSKIEVPVGVYDESSLRKALGSAVGDVVSSGGKSAKAVTNAMLNGAPKDALGIVTHALAGTSNKSEVADIVTKLMPSIEGNAKNRLIKQLTATTNPEDAAKALWGSLNTKTVDIPRTISATKLNDLRKEFDSLVNYTEKAANPARYGVNKRSANAIRETLQQAADSAGVKASNGMTFKQVGTELSKLHQLVGNIERQANLGKGSQPLGLSNLLGGSLGGISTGGNPLGSIGGIAMTQAVNSATGRKLAATGAEKLAGNLADRAVKNTASAYGVKGIAKRNLGVGLAGALASQSLENSANSMASPTTNAPMINADMPEQYTQDQQMSIEQAPSSPFDPANIEANVAKMMRSGAGVKDINAYLDMATTINSMKAAAAKASKSDSGMNTTQLQQANNAMSGLQSLERIKSTLSKNPNAAKLATLPGGSLTASLTGTGDYKAALNNAADVIGRLRSGGAINADEEKRFMAMLPQSFDSQETINYKLNSMAELFNRFANPKTASFDSADLVAALGG